MHVPSQALYEINVKSSQPFLLRNVLPGTAWAPYEAPVNILARKTNAPCEAELEDGNCLKGAVVGLCLEGAMALGLFCIWQGWHLLR
jgi:hypothetical protein